jgi:hypothetical protein
MSHMRFHTIKLAAFGRGNATSIGFREQEVESMLIPWIDVSL